MEMDAKRTFKNDFHLIVTYTRNVIKLNRDTHPEERNLQSNLNSSNTNGSFSMANSNSFSSPYEFLPIAQENKY